mmetsp:Transcript_7184/g.18350  ORF Transcript_7184/g.18350 Transcript_7184/m.18350 type:complete len:253 (+) Transcript_7184:286-1044(+)
MLDLSQEPAVNLPFPTILIATACVNHVDDVLRSDCNKPGTIRGELHRLGHDLFRGEHPLHAEFILQRDSEQAGSAHIRVRHPLSIPGNCATPDVGFAVQDSHELGVGVDTVPLDLDWLSLLAFHDFGERSLAPVRAPDPPDLHDVPLLAEHQDVAGGDPRCFTFHPARDVDARDLRVRLHPLGVLVQEGRGVAREEPRVIPTGHNGAARGGGHGGDVVGVRPLLAPERPLAPVGVCVLEVADLAIGVAREDT